MSIARNIEQKAIEKARPIFLAEGLIEGSQKTLITMLESFAPELLPKYKRKIMETQTMEAFAQLQDEVYKAIGTLK